MAGQITRYSLAWHTKSHVGKIVIEVEDDRRVTFIYNNANEFAATAAVLREAPVFYRDDVITTGVELADE